MNKTKENIKESILKTTSINKTGSIRFNTKGKSLCFIDFDDYAFYINLYYGVVINQDDLMRDL